jgi:hypothetical protein
MAQYIFDLEKEKRDLVSTWGNMLELNGKYVDTLN